MLQTSISLPETHARLWKARRSEILKLAGLLARSHVKNGVRRGVTRTYNTHEGSYMIVNARFREEHYEMLHFLAASLRVSVSSLVSQLIDIWLRPPKKKSLRQLCANYTVSVVEWGSSGFKVTEGIRFHKQRTQSNLPDH